ncbi:MAG: hypothetical protein ACI3Z9_06510 [Candidatus Onthomorpha sp.]
MKTVEKAPKAARVTLPEAIYMQIKQAVKNDPTFKTVGDYLAHQLDQVKILSCEKEKLSQKLLDERAAAGQSIAASERRVAEAEELAKKLQEDLLNVSHANTELANQNAELSQRIVNLENEKAALEVEIGNLHSLIRGYQSTVQTLKEQISAMTQKQLESSNQINGLQAALDAESVNVRKYQQESEELARKLECREEVIFGLQKEISEKETFTGKIKNLFA